LSIALSTLDSEVHCAPVAHAFTGSKASWHQPSDEIPSYEEIPDGALE
jgi:hypothetical protein